MDTLRLWEVKLIIREILDAIDDEQSDYPARIGVEGMHEHAATVFKKHGLIWTNPEED
jgi:hypothetical protein